MYVINKFSPAVQILDVTNEHGIIVSLIECYNIPQALANLLHAVFLACPNLIIRNTKNVPTSSLYKTNMVASVISGRSGQELITQTKSRDNEYYIVDFIDVFEDRGAVQFAVHRLKDSVTDVARLILIDDIIKTN